MVYTEMGMRKYSFRHLLTHWAFWHLFPTVDVSLKWPVGMITVDPDHPKWDWTLGATLQEGFSADPNDHYRPWLEKHVGKQGWDWDWNMVGNDVADNRLTLRIRRGKSKYATLAAVMWS